MKEIRRLVPRLEIQDIFLREAIEERILSEPRPLRPDFPTYRQVIRDQVTGTYYEVIFGPVTLSYVTTTKRGGVAAMSCSGGAVVISSGVLSGTSSTLGAEECPASSFCSQSEGSVTYTPHSY